jgi:hypothetical protein
LQYSRYRRKHARRYAENAPRISQLFLNRITGLETPEKAFASVGHSLAHPSG